MSKILLVEDDRILSDMVADYLSARRYTIERVSDGGDGLHRLISCHYDMAVLDVSLPGMSGLEVCRTYRERGGKIPVLMLTGNKTIDDKELGFSAGADDYLTKPFDMRELVMRVESLLRRPSDLASSTVQAGEMQLEATSSSVIKSGQKIELLPREYALLDFLMRHPGQYFTSEVLLNRVWHSEAETTSDAVRQCVKRLRSKIDVAGEPSLIKSVHKLGYKLEV